MGKCRHRFVKGAPFVSNQLIGIKDFALSQFKVFSSIILVRPHTSLTGDSPNMDWYPIKKPTEIAEAHLIQAFLSGQMQVNDTLPAERELAQMLGVTRSTLREVLQRLARDGWVDIRQGKPTRIKDFWREGDMGVLRSMTNHGEQLPQNFVKNLLAVRLDLAPSYTYAAISNHPDTLVQFLEPLLNLPDEVIAYAEADWDLHHQLTILSDNPIYTLILNGFKELYFSAGQQYFALESARQHSKHFYTQLHQAAHEHDPDFGKSLSHQVMMESIAFWQQVTH